MNFDEIFAKQPEQPLQHLVPNGGFTSIFRTIACVGDSLSSGEFEAAKEDGTSSYHDFYEYSWGQFLGRACGSTVYNFSRGGMTAQEYCESFAEHNRFWDSARAAQCYIVALGVNDLLGLKQPLGTAADDWEHPETFAGFYLQILHRLQSIQPRAKFFLVTMPDEGELEENRELKAAHAALLHEMAKTLPNTYVIDLFAYAPNYDQEFHEKFYLRGHLNPMGYQLTAVMIGSYIDFIIRHQMEDFREVGFIGTDLHG